MTGVTLAFFATAFFLATGFLAAGFFAEAFLGAAALAAEGGAKAESKVTQATVNALLIVEGTTAHSPDTLRQAVAEAAERVTHYCGGTAEAIAFPYDK